MDRRRVLPHCSAAREKGFSPPSGLLPGFQGTWHLCGQKWEVPVLRLVLEQGQVAVAF